jgi:type II secretory pathway pseudopilin PulG
VTGRQWRGMTLAETLVVASILLTLSGTLYQALLPGYQVWSRSQSRAELQDTAQIVVHELSSAVAQTDGSSVQIFPNNGTDPTDGGPAAHDTLALVSPISSRSGPTMAGGTLSWQSARIYYMVPAQRELWRMQIDFAQPSASVPNPLLSPAVMTALRSGQLPSAAGAVQRRIASNVRSLQFRGTGWPQIVTVGCAQGSASLSVETALVPVLQCLNPSTP